MCESISMLGLLKSIAFDFIIININLNNNNFSRLDEVIVFRNSIILIRGKFELRVCMNKLFKNFFEFMVKKEILLNTKSFKNYFNKFKLNTLYF